ncbi:protein canopy-1 isoform X1 [Micropterus dolomieu]|uniref:protein canopy-1 isoform X1 n=1 Tax=Micropterus dolomieu TaxID=147949 RepID=UPI001E8EED2D|nr:protein canopy-1 isoform X1 [Micropterus dolomieu]
MIADSDRETEVLLQDNSRSEICSSSQGKRDKVLYCSACKAIVDELNFSISQVDPKKTINVGSFRLNPDGTMEDKKVPLARSETHLHELLDGVCNSMSDYSLHVDPDTQHKQYMRFAPRSSETTGNFPDFKNFQFDGPEASSALKFACETVVEELEDDIISLFSQDVKHVHEELCNRVSDYCKDSSHTYQEL